MPAGSLLCTPPVLTIWLQRSRERSSTKAEARERATAIYGFGPMLEPRWIIGPEPLDQ
jgi:hypothetical protein